LANYCFHALFFLLIREPVAVETVGRLVSHLSAITWPSLTQQFAWCLLIVGSLLQLLLLLDSCWALQRGACSLVSPAI
jgi:hypothetical protein